nr:MAG TPA: YvrJ protein family protein [Caudoviricetes sp.]
MDTVITMISNVGFPIAACCGLMFFINTTIKELRTAIQQNTILLEKISAFLEREETHDGKEN